MPYFFPFQESDNRNPADIDLADNFSSGTDGILMAEPISNFIGGTACFGTMLCTVWRELGKKEKSNAQET